MSASVVTVRPEESHLGRLTRASNRLAKRLLAHPVLARRITIRTWRTRSWIKKIVAGTIESNATEIRILQPRG
jgi:hypothetical protein